MELYLSACSKAANVAATKTATSSLTTESQQCGDVSGPQAGQLCPPLSGLQPGREGREGPGRAANGHVPSVRPLTVQLPRPSSSAAAGGGAGRVLAQPAVALLRELLTGS